MTIKTEIGRETTVWIFRETNWPNYKKKTETSYERETFWEELNLFQ